MNVPVAEGQPELASSPSLPRIAAVVDKVAQGSVLTSHLIAPKAQPSQASVTGVVGVPTRKPRYCGHGIFEWREFTSDGARPCSDGSRCCALIPLRWSSAGSGEKRPHDDKPASQSRPQHCSRGNNVPGMGLDPVSPLNSTMELLRDRDRGTRAQANPGLPLLPCETQLPTNP